MALTQDLLLVSW